jgi:hypothetical protein
MKLRSTLVLAGLVIFAALAAIVIHSPQASPRAGGPPTSGAPLLPGLQADAVQSVIIERPDQPRIVCVRHADAWTLDEPVRTRANTKPINDMLGALGSARRAATFPLADQEAGRSFGLRPPQYTVTLLGSADGKEFKFAVRFGTQMPVGNLTYVAVAGSPDALAVPAQVAARADLGLADLRSNVLVPGFDPAELKALSIVAAQLGDQPAFSLECRRSGNLWELTSPVKDLADAAAVSRLADRVRRFQPAPADLVVGSPAGCGLDRPALTVTLTGAQGPQTLLLSYRPEACYAMLEGESAPVRVSADFFNALRRSPDSLRQHALAGVRADDVSGVELTDGGGSTSLVRRMLNWQLAGTPAAAADQDLVTGMLSALCAAQARAFPAALPEGCAATSVTLKGAAGDLAEFQLYRDGHTGDVYAARSGYGTLLLLQKDDRLAALFGGRLGLLDRSLLQAPAAGAVRMDVHNAAGTFRADAAGGWRLTAPVSGPVDQGAVDGILSSFADLRAQAFAAEAGADPAAYGLDAPQATVTVSYQSASGAAPATHTVRMGKAASGGGVYGSLDDDSRVFVLPGGVADKLRAGLASRGICQTKSLTGLTFRRGKRTMEYRFDAAEVAWSYPSGLRLQPIGQSALRDIAALLADFQGSAVADYVLKDPALYGFNEPFLEVDLAEKTTSGKRIVVGKQAPGGGRYVIGPATGFVLIATDRDVARLSVGAAEPRIPLPRSR